jgi:hypothetical protein
MRKIMHYKNITFHPASSEQYRRGLLIAGTLKGEIWNETKIHRSFERLMFKTPSGEEAFSSWWELAREHGAIN